MSHIVFVVEVCATSVKPTMIVIVIRGASLQRVCRLVTAQCRKSILWLWSVGWILRVARLRIVLILFAISNIFARRERTSSLRDALLWRWVLILSLIIVIVLLVFMVICMLTPVPNITVRGVLLLLSSIHRLRVVATFVVLLILAIAIRPLVLLPSVTMIHPWTGVLHFWMMIILSLLIVISHLVAIVIVAIIPLLTSFNRRVRLTITLCVMRTMILISSILIAGAILSSTSILFSIIIHILVVLITLNSIMLNRIHFTHMPILAPLAIAVAFLACCGTI
jgi:hypothetical protein